MGAQSPQQRYIDQLLAQATHDAIDVDAAEEEDDIVLITDCEGNVVRYRVMGGLRVDDDPSLYYLLVLADVVNASIQFCRREEEEDGSVDLSDVTDPDLCARLRQRANELAAQARNKT